MLSVGRKKRNGKKTREKSRYVSARKNSGYVGFRMIIVYFYFRIDLRFVSMGFFVNMMCCRNVMGTDVGRNHHIVYSLYYIAFIVGWFFVCFNTIRKSLIIEWC